MTGEPMKALLHLIDRYVDARVQAELVYERDGSFTARKRCDEREKAAWAELLKAIEALP